MAVNGEFAVRYRVSEGGPLFSMGKGESWTEADATRVAGVLRRARPRHDVWIVHQDPATGMWRRW